MYLGCMHACMYVGMYECMLGWMYVCMYVCVYIGMYVCMYFLIRFIACSIHYLHYTGNTTSSVHLFSTVVIFDTEISFTQLLTPSMILS